MLYCPSMDRVIPNLRLFLILVSISILFLIFDHYHLLIFPQRLVSYITNPISFGLYQTNKNIGSQFGFAFTLRASSQENKALKEQLGLLLSENARIRKQLAETQSVVSQQKYLDPSTYNL